MILYGFGFRPTAKFNIVAMQRVCEFVYNCYRENSSRIAISIRVASVRVQFLACRYDLRRFSSSSKLKSPTVIAFVISANDSTICKYEFCTSSMVALWRIFNTFIGSRKGHVVGHVVITLQLLYMRSFYFLNQLFIRYTFKPHVWFM